LKTRRFASRFGEDPELVGSAAPGRLAAASLGRQTPTLPKRQLERVKAKPDREAASLALLSVLVARKREKEPLANKRLERDRKKESGEAEAGRAVLADRECRERKAKSMRADVEDPPFAALDARMRVGKCERTKKVEPRDVVVLFAVLDATTRREGRERREWTAKTMREERPAAVDPPFAAQDARMRRLGMESKKKNAPPVDSISRLWTTLSVTSTCEMFLGPLRRRI